MNRNMTAKCNLAGHLGEQNRFVASANIRFSDSILNNVYTNPGLGSQLQIASPGQIKSTYPRIIDVYGQAAGESANRALALRARKRAEQIFAKHGIPSSGTIMLHDQNPIFSGYGQTGQWLLSDSVSLSYTFYTLGRANNTEMESFFSRFKAEGYFLFPGYAEH